MQAGRGLSVNHILFEFKRLGHCSRACAAKQAGSAAVRARPHAAALLPGGPAAEPVAAGGARISASSAAIAHDESVTAAKPPITPFKTTKRRSRTSDPRPHPPQPASPSAAVIHSTDKYHADGAKLANVEPNTTQLGPDAVPTASCITSPTPSPPAEAASTVTSAQDDSSSKRAAAGATVQPASSVPDGTRSSGVHEPRPESPSPKDGPAAPSAATPALWPPTSTVSIIRKSYLVSDASKGNPVYRLIRRKELQRKFNAQQRLRAADSMMQITPAAAAHDVEATEFNSQGSLSQAAGAAGLDDPLPPAAGSDAAPGVSGISRRQEHAAEENSLQQADGSPPQQQRVPAPRSVIDEGYLVGDDARANPVYRAIRRTELERRYNINQKKLSAASRGGAAASQPQNSNGSNRSRMRVSGDEAAASAVLGEAAACTGDGGGSVSQSFALASERSKLNEVYRLIRRKELQRRWVQYLHWGEHTQAQCFCWGNLSLLRSLRSAILYEHTIIGM